MANDKSFKIKNGLLAGRYLQSNGVEAAGTEGYSLASASYDSVSFSVTQDTVPYGAWFKPDGTKVFVLGRTNDTVYQYSLSTAWDIGTASYDSKSFSVVTQENQPNGISFKLDGTKMYICGTGGDDVNEYSLSTAWDISTASYTTVFSLTSQTNNPDDIEFKSDGTKMYMVSDQYGYVYQYSLSTAWDISTLSYDSVSFDASGQTTSAKGIYFKSDGFKMYIASYTGVYQYSLSTAWDLSTASYDNQVLDATSQEVTVVAFSFNDDGSKGYVIGPNTDKIHQYSTVGYTQALDLSTGNTFSFTPSGATDVSFTNPPASGTAIGFAVEINGDGSAITWPSSVKWPIGTAPTATASKELYTFITTDGGTTYYGKKAAGDIA